MNLHVSLQLILEKVLEQGSHVLSLSDLQFLRSLFDNHQSHGLLETSHHSSHQSDAMSHSNIEDMKRAWEEEKGSLIAAMTSLKDLLAETHKTKDSSRVRSCFLLVLQLHSASF